MTRSKSALLIIVFTAAAMLCLADSSPLINISRSDSSVFITAGRAMLSEKVMYRDIFDHKGLYIFLVNCIAAMIDAKSLIGVWLLETLFMLANAFIVMKIYQQVFAESDNVISSQVLVLCVLFPLVFEGGNLTEEYTLPFQFLSIYLLVKYINSGEVKHSPLIMLIHGINAGIALNFRPNHVLMWVPIALIMSCSLIYNKEYANLIKNFLAGLAGLALGVMPVVIYAIVNGVLYDVIFWTFICNFMYINTSETSFIYRVFNIVFHMREMIIIVALLLSCLVVIFHDKFRRYRLYYLLMIIAGVTAVSLSGRRYGHYYIYLMPLLLPVIFVIAGYVSRIKLAGKLQTLITFVLILYCSFMAVTGHKPLSSTARKVFDDFPVINTENKRVLVTGNRAAYYVKFGIIPREKYYFLPSLQYDKFPEPVDSQAESILSNVNDMIFYTGGSDARFAQTGRLDLIHETLAKNYDLLMTHNDTKIYGKKNLLP